MRIVLSAVLALIIFTASSQNNETLSFPLDKEPFKMECAAFENFVFVLGKQGSAGQLLFKVINTEKKVIADQGKQDLNSFSNIVDVVGDDKRIYVYVATNGIQLNVGTKSALGGSVHCLIFDRATGKLAYTEEVEQGKTKRHVCYINHDNRFTIVSLTKVKNEIELVEYAGSKITKRSSYKTIDSELFSYFEENAFKYVSDKNAHLPYIAAKKRKLYHNNGNLVGTIDDWTSPGGINTTVLHFDTLKHIIYYKLLYINERDHTSNLYGDFLYVYAINADNLALSILQFKDFKKVKSFNYNRGEPIDIIQSNVLQFTEYEPDKNLSKAAGEKASEESEISKFLFRELRTNGEPFVVIEEENETAVKLKLGAFTAAVSTPSQTMSVPGGSPIFIGGGNVPESTTFFLSYLEKPGFDLSTSTPNAASASRPAHSRLLWLRQSLKLGEREVFNAGSQTWLIYVDKAKDTINLERF